MCGILLAYSKQERINPAACRRALSILSWRGPDSSHYHLWDNCLFLGQTILSITGEPLARGGAHLISASGRYRVLFNGEIYNFRSLEKEFLSEPHLLSQRDNDTEVLATLHEVLSPEEVHARLDGMFAYIIFDQDQKRLHIGRDVQGEKSLFIFEDEKWLLVSSEIRPILLLAPYIGIDVQALRDYFRTRHLMLLGRTVYRGVRTVSPGSLLSYDLVSSKWMFERRERLSDWIDAERLCSNESRSIESLADELDSLLTRCVSEMVPLSRHYAVVISGGVDSSLLGHYFIKDHSPDFLVSVNHKGKDRISSDLSGFERVLGLPIDTVEVDMPAYAAEITRCQRVSSSPLYSHSFVPQSMQSARVRAAGCRVLIGGEGGDELFGGYNAYLEGYSSGSIFSPSPYTSHFDPVFAFEEDDASTMQDALRAIWQDALQAYSFIENKDDRVRLAMMYCDAAFQLPEVGLRGADFMSMMWSVETRSVYVRRPIVKFALNLPTRMKADTGELFPLLFRTKPILKTLFVRYFPENLLFEKQGFAGFPNESAKFLGNEEDFLSLDFLSIRRDSVRTGMNHRDSAWKLTNVEYFLRNHLL